MSYLEENMKTLNELAIQISNWISINGVTNFHLQKLQSLLEEYNGNDWKPCSKVKDCKYCRHKQNIQVKYYGEIYDIFILTWRPGCGTPIHNHPKTGCIYKVLEGELIEQIYDSNQKITSPLKETRLQKGNVGYIDDKIGFHRIFNPTKEMCVSIHIYETGYKPECFSCFDVS